MVVDRGGGMLSSLDMRGHLLYHFIEDVRDIYQFPMMEVGKQFKMIVIKNIVPSFTCEKFLNDESIYVLGWM